MITWYTIFSYSIISAALMLAILGLWFTAIIPVIDRFSKKFFLAYFAVIMLCSLVSLADMFLYLYVDVTVMIIFGFFESLLLSLPMPMLTAYLLHCCRKVIKRSPVMRITNCFWVAFLLLLISTFFTKYIYYITPNEQFMRGKWFPILIIPLNAIMLLNFVCLIRWRKLLSRKYYFAFIIALFPLAVSLLVHTFADVTALIDISTVLSAISMFGLIMSEQIEQNLRQQQEIARQQASINVLQMRPHFICNTMMSIYYLIPQDAQKAQQVTLDFTTYLRNNFTAIAKPDTIPFEEELAHTKAFLSVEMVRHEGALFVDYDTPHTDFRLPPLTLQPIVENAVIHGVSPDLKALHISIHTKKTDDGSEITVKDTGEGFDIISEDTPHTALENIRQRLHDQCGGSLNISSHKNGGTTVTVFIPEYNKKL